MASRLAAQRKHRRVVVGSERDQESALLRARPWMMANAYTYYRIDLDRIFMPAFASFEDLISYIFTYAHEAAHAIGAKHRHDREARSSRARLGPRNSLSS